MMPEHFGAAFLIRRNQATPQHYVFGLEDLPGRESLPKTRYGEYLRPDGTPSATSPHRIPLLPACPRATIWCW
ncbi:hypothetical protein HXV84_24310 [Pseudomonas amygdali pv. morsprunorum]|nr:hypothetical protein [Pseudomonas amygdali pv. morsprunorum]